MARYQINHYVDTPFGQLHIFTDPAETARAEKLIKDCPKILWESWKDACERWGNKIVKEAKRCINTGMPPKGGKNWDKLSPKYVDWANGDDRIYQKSEQYIESIGVHKDNVYWQHGGLNKQRYFVGLGPLQQMKDIVRGKTPHNITLNKVAQILEEGSHGKHPIPERPLWKPLFAAAGGKDRIKVYVRNALKRKLSKYL